MNLNFAKRLPDSQVLNYQVAELFDLYELNLDLSNGIRLTYKEEDGNNFHIKTESFDKPEDLYGFLFHKIIKDNDYLTSPEDIQRLSKKKVERKNGAFNFLMKHRISLNTGTKFDDETAKTFEYKIRGKKMGMVIVGELNLEDSVRKMQEVAIKQENAIKFNESPTSLVEIIYTKGLDNVKTFLSELRDEIDINARRAKDALVNEVKGSFKLQR